MKRLLLIGMAVVASILLLRLASRAPATNLEPTTFANGGSAAPQGGAGAEKRVAPKDRSPRGTNEFADAGQASEGGWAESLDQILRTENSESEKAAVLLGAMPGLKEGDQIETARHLVNLLRDDEFWLAAGYLTNTAAPVEVSEIFYHDLFLRPDNVKLPLLLELAKMPNQPLAGQALEALAGHFLEDHQTNWAKWSEAIHARLQEE